MAGLAGMKEICSYLNRSEATVLQWHRDYDLPLVKLGGTWLADTDKIDEWRKKLIEGRTTLNGKGKVAKAHPPRRKNGRKQMAGSGERE